jgi:hypothetical protein
MDGATYGVSGGHTDVMKLLVGAKADVEVDRGSYI